MTPARLCDPIFHKFRDRGVVYPVETLSVEILNKLLDGAEMLVRELSSN
jgi:hypothetical protein